MKPAGTPAIAVVVRSIAFGDGVGGMERAASRHIESMLATFHSVVLYTPLRNLRGDLPDGLDVVDVPWPRWDVLRPLTFGPAYRCWVRRAASALKVDASHIGYAHLHGAAAGAVPLLGGMRTAHNPHGLEEFGPFSLLRSWNRVFIRRLVRKGRSATVVISTDESVTSKIIASMRVAPEKIRLVANAVDASHLEEESTAAEPLLADLVSIGRLNRNKGYDLLVKAIRLVQVQLDSPLSWIHFGSGPELPRIQRIAAGSPRVDLQILESCSDAVVLASLRSAKLFAQPSRDEGSSLTTLEAMALGKIVVATPVGGIPDKIQDGHSGYLATEPTVEAIALAILRALEGPDTGAAAQAVALGRFGVTNEAAQYAKLSTDLGASPDADRSAKNA